MDSLRVKIFADGADLAALRSVAALPFVRGFTTNAGLMRRAGVRDYRAFAHELLSLAGERSVSFAVTSTDLDEMERAARAISGWGDHVYVKIPITTAHGASTLEVVRRLSGSGTRVNVTCVFTDAQIARAAAALRGGAPSFISVLAGRVADTGRDPVPQMRAAVESLAQSPEIELMWASPREVLNVVQADQVGCHVITATTDLLAKLPTLGRELEAFSLETIRSLDDDAARAGYRV